MTDITWFARSAIEEWEYVRTVGSNAYPHSPWVWTGRTRKICLCPHKGTSVNHLPRCPFHKPPPGKEFFALEAHMLLPWQLDKARRIRIR